MIELFAAGIALNTFSTIFNYSSNRKAARDAQAAAREQARIQRRRGDLAAADILEEGAEVAGAIRARALSSGAEIGGSPYLAIKEAMESSQKDARRVVKYGEEEASYISKRGRAQSSAYKRQATGALLSGVASTATMVGQYYNTTKAAGSGGDGG